MEVEQSFFVVVWSVDLSPQLELLSQSHEYTDTGGALTALQIITTE